jgi:hypothetical protein
MHLCLNIHQADLKFPAWNQHILSQSSKSKNGTPAAAKVLLDTLLLLLPFLPGIKMIAEKCPGSSSTFAVSHACC